MEIEKTSKIRPNPTPSATSLQRDMQQIASSCVCFYPRRLV
jgi:hypothetical protein